MRALERERAVKGEQVQILNRLDETSPCDAMHREPSNGAHLLLTALAAISGRRTPLHTELDHRRDNLIVPKEQRAFTNCLPLPEFTLKGNQIQSSVLKQIQSPFVGNTKANCPHYRKRLLQDKGKCNLSLDRYFTTKGGRRKSQKGHTVLQDIFKLKIKS